jgi:hypothetical protein
MGGMMAISRRVGKSIMDEIRWKYYDSRTDSFDYKRMELDLKIDQIIHNEAIKAKEGLNGDKQS